MELKPSRHRSASGRDSGPSNAPGGPEAVAASPARGIHGGRAQPCEALPRLRLHRRNLAVRRIDQDGAALLAVDGDDLPALLDPEPVVAAGPAAGELLDRFEPRLRRDAFAAGRRRFAIAADRRGVLGLALQFVCLGRRRLFGGEHQAATGVRRPLDRRHGRDVIEPLEIGMAIGRAWQGGGCASRRGLRLCVGGRFGGLRAERPGGAYRRDRNHAG